MFISKLGLGLRDNNSSVSKSFAFLSPPPSWYVVFGDTAGRPKCGFHSGLATEPTGVSEGRPRGQRKAGGGMRLVPPVFPSKLSHVIKYHGGGQQKGTVGQSVFLSELSHVSKHGTRGG